jgi:hypothetical protein
MTEQPQQFPPPEPTGDPLIDEVRRMKWEVSARFGHDPKKLFEYLRELQKSHPGGIAKPIERRPGEVA